MSIPVAPAAPVTQAPAPVDPSAPPVTPPEPAKKEDPFSARFAALSRQEKAFRAEQAAAKSQRESETKEWTQRIEAAKRYEALKARAQTDTSAAQELLKEAGLTYDQLTKLHINGGKPTSEMIAEEARREAAAIRKELADRDETAKQESEKQKAERVTQAITQFKTQIEGVLKAKPDEFELTLNFQDPHSGATGPDLVYQVIEAHYDQTEKETGTGRVMSHEDAAKAVEAWLEKDYEEKILSRKKIQAKLGKPADGPKPGDPASPPVDGVVSPGAQPASARTLTNQDQTTVATAPKPKSMSRQESLAEAAKLLKWS